MELSVSVANLTTPELYASRSLAEQERSIASPIVWPACSAGIEPDGSGCTFSMSASLVDVRICRAIDR